MLKVWRMVTAIITALFAVVIIWQARHCHGAAKQCSAANPQSGTPTTVSGVKQQQKPLNEANNSCYDANSFLCSVLTPANLPSLLLIIVGLGGIVVAALTLDVLTEQTEAAKDAAKAARDSATAMINTERAWVMVDIEPVTAGITVMDTMSPSGKKTGDRLGCPILCICANHGKTPAKIIEKRIEVLVVSPTQPLPPEPNLDAAYLFDPEPSYLAAGARQSKDWEVEGHKSGITSFFVIYGVVRYQHILSEQTVQTTFGYRVIDIEGTLERLTGYPKYNEHT